jgi:hypothetical protein
MTSESTFRIPRNYELVPLNKKGAKVDIKPQIEAALNDDAIIDRIEEYKINDGVTGDAKIDDVRVMDIIVAWDDKHSGLIRNSGLKEVEILQAVNVVLRRRYVLNKKRKIIGINEKRYQLLTHE